MILLSNNVKELLKAASKDNFPKLTLQGGLRWIWVKGFRMSEDLKHFESLAEEFKCETGAILKLENGLYCIKVKIKNR